MARYQRTDSNVVFNPTVLKLKTSAHRASLDGNEVAVLSGRDPKEYGSIGRMPGGLRVSTDYPSEASTASCAKFFHREGLLNGDIIHTTTTNTATIGATSVVAVKSTAGFELGQWAVVYDSNNAYIGQITTITSTSITLTQVGNGSVNNTASIASGATVLVTAAVQVATVSTSATSANVRWATNLQIGMDARIVIHRGGGLAYQTVQIKSFTPATTNGITVAWDDALTTGFTTTTYAIVPYMTYAECNETFIPMANGNLERLRSGSYKNIWDASTAGFQASQSWNLALYDRSILAVNGYDKPKRITMHTLGFDNSVVGQQPPAEYVGFPPVPALASTTWSTNSGGGMSAGIHKVFVRLLDKSVYPICKSPPIEVKSFDIAANDYIALDVHTLMTAATGLMQNNYIGEGCRRATHMQIWCTTANGGTFYLVAERHLSGYLTSSPATGWITGGSGEVSRIIDSDAALVVKDSLDSNDYAKGLMPKGTLVHHFQGVTLVAGNSYPSELATNEYPEVNSGNMLFFSRTDADEPENFPPLNFRQIGKHGDKIMGFVDAGDCVVVLSRFSFTVIQRAGTFLIFREGSLGKGTYRSYGHVSLGQHAAWIGEKQIWLFDGSTLEEPRDIGFPIRNWVEDERPQIMGFHPIEGLLFVVNTDGDREAEAKIYSFEDGAWTTRENFAANALFTGFAVRNSSSDYDTYRLIGSPPNCIECINYTANPKVDGNFANTLSGSIAAGSHTSVSGLSTFEGASDAMRGIVAHFIDGDGTESIRIITASTSSSFTWSTSLTISASGGTWIIGNIPFRLRFPPIRGEDPFTAKIARGVIAMFDNVRFPSGVTAANLTVKLFRNYADTPATGATGTLEILDTAATIDRRTTSDVQTTGKVIELQLEQINSHVDFSVVYASLGVSIPGVLREDSNASV